MLLRRRPSLANFRRRLAHVDAVAQLSLLAVISGALTGVVMVAFRFALEYPLAQLLPGGDAENFEALPPGLRLALPLASGLLLGIVMQELKPTRRPTGVVHVIERLVRHQGHLPAGNAMVQIPGVAAALANGHSGGREGPAIHLGAAASSLLGQRLKLPNNSIRTLVGCGTAAAIAASFNTPIAGVIFAMEVVMMEYSVTSFIPVIVAAVTAALVSIAVYGPSPAFDVPALQMHSLLEIPLVIVQGLAIGLLAAGFVRITALATRLQVWPTWLRLTLAGALTGLVALGAPQVMGVGYDTVDAALVGQLTVTTLLVVTVAKLLVSAAAMGLGIPAGLIGPTLVIGATAGGAFGLLGNQLIPEVAASAGFYVILGMSAMMGAVLQAPLAALMAVMELTLNPNIILPAMLAIVVASLTMSEMLRTRSIFMTALAARGLKALNDPVTQALQRAGVASVMERRFVRLAPQVTAEQARTALERRPRWIVVEREHAPVCVVSAQDLARYLETPPESDADHRERRRGKEPPENDAPRRIDLLEIPALRMDVDVIDLQATLHEGLEQLERGGKEALCVLRTSAPLITPVAGVVTRADIDKFYGFRG